MKAQKEPKADQWEMMEFQQSYYRKTNVARILKHELESVKASVYKWNAQYQQNPQLKRAVL